MFAARQFVNHGHVLVNGKRVNIPSFRVKEGDVIEVRDKSKQIAVLLEAVQLPRGMYLNILRLIIRKCQLSLLEHQI